MTALKVSPQTTLRCDTAQSQTNTLIDYEKLSHLGETHSNEYQQGLPFPHITFDDFLPEQVFQQVLDALPLFNERQDFLNFTANMNNGKPAQAEKYHLSDVLQMKPILRNLIFELNSGPFLAFVEQLTGITGLLPDPLLQGGGVHMTGRGGLLRVHADFNKHAIYKYDRRVNLLLYCNQNWKEEYGGHLELWPKDMSVRGNRILPIANRCAMFSTTSESFHGHPHPLNCPEGEARKSIALYYYTVGRPSHEAQPKHETLWQTLPTEETTQEFRPPKSVRLRRKLKAFRQRVGHWIAGT